MKKFRNIQILIALSIALMLSACQEDITDMSFNSTYTRLVVEGSITTDTMAHKVILSRSSDLLDSSDTKYISGAVISITDGANIFALTEDTAHKGTYLTNADVYGVPGRTYTLNITSVDIDKDGTYEQYHASSEMKRTAQPDSFHIVENNMGRDQKFVLINLYAGDFGGGRNFYLIKMLKNDTLLTDSIFKYTYTDNLGFEGGYYNGFPVYQLNSEMKQEKLRINDVLTLEMYGINEPFYNFINEAVQEYYPKIPLFSGPAANISTNIEPKDKAVGFFSASSVMRSSKTFERFDPK